MSPRLGEIDYGAMLDAYIEAALWSTNDESTEDGGKSLDANYSRNDIDPLTLRTMDADCHEFVEGIPNDDLNLYFEAMRDVSGGPETQMGHDFWLTRNGHGAGFWDRDELMIDARPALGSAPRKALSLGERLTKHAHAAGVAELYVGDDKVIYQSGAEPERVHEDAILGLDDRETSTILAALRLWQRRSFGLLADLNDYELDIATNCGRYSRLSPEQIDDLCERLNCERT